MKKIILSTIVIGAFTFVMGNESVHNSKNINKNHEIMHNRQTKLIYTSPQAQSVRERGYSSPFYAQISQ